METATIALRSRRPGAGRAAVRTAAPAIAAIATWVALIAVAHLWGSSLNDSGLKISLNAPPLFGYPDLRIGPGAAIPVATALALVAAAPVFARRAPWPALPWLAGAGALGWAVALALTAGAQGLTAPLEGPSEYLTNVHLVGSPGELLSTFTERIDDFATHVRSHPPGMLLALWGLDAAGLGGSGPAAALVLAVGASAVPAALLATRAVAGERCARRATPFLIVIPGAVWIATTADALYMGVGAWAVAATVLAVCARGRRSAWLAAAGGLAFGLCLFLSYGLVLLALIPLAVAVARRRVAPLAVAAVAAGAVVAGFLAAGFWWLDGYAAIREQYLASIARTRPYDFFLVNNLAAFALAAGPAAAIALARLRDRALWLLVGGAAAAIAIADLSGMSKAEVERIWLPFLPWILVATAALPAALWAQRALLGAQAACAIAIQVGVRTIW